MVLLPDTDASGALAVSQRIRMNLRELGYGPDNGAIPVFVSFGVATYPLDGCGPANSWQLQTPTSTVRSIGAVTASRHLPKGTQTGNRRKEGSLFSKV